MKRTRLSLYSLASYLTLGGIALMAVPDVFVRLLFSNAVYSDVVLRFLGIMLVSLGIIVIRIIHLKVESLYTTTLIVRLFICAGLIGLYVDSHDPLFLTLIAIVGLGVMLTGMSYLQDRRQLAP